MAVRLAAFGTGALSVSVAISLALLTTSGAAAQTSASQPKPVTGFVSTYEIMRTVRSAGFDPLVPPLREGTIYVLRATDFRGILMRVVLDARTGAIRDVTRIVPATSGRIGMMPPRLRAAARLRFNPLRLARRIWCSNGDGARRRAGAIVAAGSAVCDCSGAPAIPAAAAAAAGRTGLAKAAIPAPPPRRGITPRRPALCRPVPSRPPSPKRQQRCRPAAPAAPGKATAGSADQRLIGSRRRRAQSTPTNRKRSGIPERSL